MVVIEDTDRNGTADSTRTEMTYYENEGRVIPLISPEGTIHCAYNDLGQRTGMWTGNFDAAHKSSELDPVQL